MEKIKRFLKVVAPVAAVVLSVAAMTAMVFSLAFAEGSTQKVDAVSSVDVGIVDRFDMRLNNRISEALDGVLSIDKVYWLNDDDQIAPEPDQSKFGVARSASELDWLLEEAADIMDGQQLHFNTGIRVHPGTDIRYYLDETIFAITWKQQFDGGIYTISEVKIRHPSQLRRFLAGGEYGSEIRLKTTDMAKTVNAVVASSGDYYAYRRHGVIVYDGIVRRVNSGMVDTCYIDDKGDMLFSYAGELPTMEAAQRFVDENNIRFSMAFGPVIIDHGKSVPVGNYALGEVSSRFARAALCQKGPLHYIVLTVNGEKGYYRTATMFQLAHRIKEMDVEMAYALDGGQTAVIVMNDKMINAVHDGSQRYISDIFYFATAFPAEE